MGATGRLRVKTNTTPPPPLKILGTCHPTSCEDPPGAAATPSPDEICAVVGVWDW